MSRYINSSDEQRRAFAIALESAMHAAGITSAAELYRRGTAAGIKRTQDTFTTWLRGEVEPARGDVLILEQLCELPVGHLSRHLGWVPVGIDIGPSIEVAILADRDLTDDQKGVLLTVLESYRKP